MRKEDNKPADLILYNGKIVSGDEAGSIYEAIAVKADKIVCLGTTGQVLSLKGNQTGLINLNGKVLIPGLVESHSHILQAALSEIRGELFIPSSVKELLNYIKEKVAKIEKGDWMYFKNVYPARLDEYRFPTIEELDAAAPENPVYIDAVFAGQANSCALKAVCLDEATTLPHGRICRDKKTGKVNGTLFLLSDLFTKYMAAPVYEEGEVLASVEKLLHNYSKLGITSVIDGSTSARAVDIFNRLYGSGRLKVRLAYTFPAGAIKNIREGIREFIAGINTPPEWGKPGFLKKIIDGGILTGTCFMRKPYGDNGRIFGIDDDKFCGIVLLEKEQLIEYMEAAYESGLQMTAHCIGDAATDMFLSAYEDFNKIEPIYDKRFSIIHADFTDTETLKRVKKLGLVIISQPAWHYKDGSILSKILDGGTLESFLPYKNMEDMGVNVCAGSDHMVKFDSFLSQNPYNPFLGMYNMITRKTRKGDIIHASQKVSRERALQMYTLNGAYASFDEKVKGSLKVGKLADMVVLSKDYFACEEEEIPSIESELTITGGKIAYDGGLISID